MRILLAVLAGLLAVAPAASQARPYGSYDLRKGLTEVPTPAGPRPAIDLAYLDRMIDDIASHAKNYPPVFDSQDDKDRATRDVRLLATSLAKAAEPADADPEIVLRAAFVHALAHNLETEGAGEKAEALYKRLMAAHPESGRTNYLYGSFLASSSRFKESLPPLETAAKLGVPDALYSLGMVQLSLGNRKKAIDYLEQYRVRVRDDGSIARVIELIRSGKLEIRKESR
jgi:tetratricopeptide (TPR) repeat protein